MKTYINLLAAIAMPLSVLIGCGTQEIKPIELLKNTTFEGGATVPVDWGYITGKDFFIGEWNDKEFVSPNRSAKITAVKSDTFQIAFWYQTISDNLPFGKDVTLRVKIKGKLNGKGVSIAIRTDDTEIVSGRAEQFITTENLSPITGIFDWTEKTIALSNIRSSSKSITVYFIYLPNTTGEVYFDNASLTY